LRKYIVRSVSRTALGPAALLVCSVVSAWFLAGCGVTPYTAATNTNTMSISGTAFGGQPPITGATIQVFATGQTGYGSAPSFLGGATTDSTGHFQVTNFTPCSDPQQVYLVATGGNPGLSPSNTNNSAIRLVAALGTCSSVGASTVVNVNEVTTIAAAYALSGFADVANFNIGTSSTNPSGLQHAFLNAANIVNFTSGSANTTTPGGNGTVPTSMINTLADILEPCVNSTSGASTGCVALFSNAQPPSATGIAAPTNTWQAALDMAQYPGNNTATLFGLVLPSPSFQPTIGATAPNDLSIGILYSAGIAPGTGGTTATFPWGIASDMQDNVWITGLSGVNDDGLVELSSAGNIVPLMGSSANFTQMIGAFTHQVAVDPHGNILTVDTTSGGGNLYQYVPATGVTNVFNATQLGITSGIEGIAADKNNNVWFATEGSAAAQTFGKLSYTAGTNTLTPVTLTPPGTIAASGVSALTVDANNGNVWGPSQNSTAGSTNYFLSPFTSAPGLIATGDTTNYAAAIDANDNVWITGTKTGANASSLFMVSHLNPTGTPTTINATVPTGGLGLDGSRSIMIDGLGRIFVNSFTAGTIVEYNPNLGSGGTFFLTAAGNGFAPFNAGGVTNSALVKSGDRTMAIDAAGALWTVNATSTSIPVVQILGIAAPTVPVLSLGMYGVEP